MKNTFVFLAIGSLILSATSVKAQDDKSKRASPPASVSQTIKSGATVKIDYSQPSLKGRTIGKDVEPNKGKAWRMGANEATVFEVNKDVKIEGKTLPAGKYSLFGIMGDNEFTLIFNKAYNIWGTTYEQNKAKDVLQVKVKPSTGNSSVEKLKYTIDPSGKVTLYWGDLVVPFQVS
ncbi:MAG TPA: DUF2911 domain-containing protein [Flavisolibacter sp.]|nr:DUF2911 domain-containing protein [Flavisolibacter sp.]